MNYEDTKRTCMDSYPTLFINEASVLNHLFFVIGNGYAWENGELVGDDYDYCESTKYALDSLTKFAEDNIRYEEKFIKDLMNKFEWLEGREIKKIIVELYGRMSDIIYWNNYIKKLRLPPDKQREIEIQKILNYINDDDDQCCYFLTDNGEIGRDIYPLCEYSKIMVIPKDVKPDWLDAARRAITMARGPLFKITEKDERFLNKAEENIRNIHLKQHK